jgi:hypothetical protein
MRTETAIHRWLSEAEAWIHAVRARAIAFAVVALLHHGRLSLTRLGRAGLGPVSAKHRITRIDRLLGNRHLECEVDTFARWLAEIYLRESPQPTILVDWTPLYRPFYALTAAVPRDGRALLIAWSVHHERRVGAAGIQRAFLKKLQRIVPAGCRPVIVTDAGFHTPWFKAVQSNGWDYVGRVRGNVHYSTDGESWRPIADVHHRARLHPIDLGNHLVSKGKTRTDRLVIVRGRRKPGPKKKRSKTKHRPGPQAKRAQRSELTLTQQQNKHRRSANEPWVLSTSLSCSAELVVAVYRRRMLIEETYRHFKSPRFGWGFEHVRTNNPRRLNVLLLLVALAIAFTNEVGRRAEQLGLQREYQANTVRDRRVLSTLTLGQYVLIDAFRRPYALLLAAIAALSLGT